MARSKRRAVPCGGEGSDEAELLEAPRSRAVIRAELRDLCELHVTPETLAWLKERYPNVWPRPMRQMELFR